jgi:hypothetical protein
MFFKLTGSTCSGKSAVARRCADVAGLVVHDFDEVGVPPDADTAWRQRTTECWIQKVLEYQARGLDVLLTGQSPLGEILASPSSPLLNGIAVCLLDVQDDQRMRRLDARDPDKWDGAARKAFIGWARWHRAHAVDPRAQPQVITAGGWERMRWERWVNWTGDEPLWRCPTVDTTDRTIAETTAAVRSWIENGRADLADGRLTLAQGWA